MSGWNLGAFCIRAADWLKLWAPFRLNRRKHLNGIDPIYIYEIFWDIYSEISISYIYVYTYTYIHENIYEMHPLRFYLGFRPDRALSLRQSGFGNSSAKICKVSASLSETCWKICIWICIQICKRFAKNCERGKICRDLHLIMEQINSIYHWNTAFGDMRTKFGKHDDSISISNLIVLISD